MGRTRLAHLSAVEIASGVPRGVDKPIKPEKFMGTERAALAKLVGITQFGVNRVTIQPGCWSALRHFHEAEDEFVLMLAGELVLVDDNGAHPLVEGSFVGFPAGCRNAHHLQNRSQAPATYIVVGSRKPGADTVHYPDDPLGPIRK